VLFESQPALTFEPICTSQESSILGLYLALLTNSAVRAILNDEIVKCEVAKSAQHHQSGRGINLTLKSEVQELKADKGETILTLIVAACISVTPSRTRMRELALALRKLDQVPS
jgi:hypothetical protein